MPDGSYTAYLFKGGLEKILKKVGEESAETIIAAMKGDAGEAVRETADLCYHMLVLLCEMGIEPGAIAAELGRRHAEAE
jgi:phosphoribosyl-ATP pyrophosphohydrolase